MLDNPVQERDLIWKLTLAAVWTVHCGWGSKVEGAGAGWEETVKGGGPPRE